MEVEYKWVLILDKAFSHLQAPSDTAKPLPAHLQHKNCATEDPANEIPKVDEPFFDENHPQILAEFVTYKPTALASPKVELGKNKQLWYYLGKTSTEAKAQYTSDATSTTYDPKSNFLDSVRPPMPAVVQGYQDVRKQVQTQIHPLTSAIHPPSTSSKYNHSTGHKDIPLTKSLYPNYHNDLIKNYSIQEQQRNRGIFIGSSSNQNLTSSKNPWISGSSYFNGAFTTSNTAAETSRHSSNGGPLNFGTAKTTPLFAAPQARMTGNVRPMLSTPASHQISQSSSDSGQQYQPQQKQKQHHSVATTISSQASGSSISHVSTFTPHQQTFRFREQYQGSRRPPIAKSSKSTSSNNNSSGNSSATNTNATTTTTITDPTVKASISNGSIPSQSSAPNSASATVAAGASAPSAVATKSWQRN